MKPIERVSVTDMVVANLKELIKSGEMQIGDKFPTEMEICDNLNVSRSTVREAFRYLQATGLIEMKPGRGAFISKLKEDDSNNVMNWFSEHEIQITDFMEARMAIEPYCVKLAIKRATDEEINAIEKICSDLEKAAADKDLIKVVNYDVAFHNEIVKASHNKLLISISEKISEVFSEYRRRAFALKNDDNNGTTPHRRILQAIKEKNAKLGEIEMINHLNISLQDILKVLKK